jgi:hypothetical protein
MKACWQNKGKEYRSGVLARAITVVQYLAERYLAFQGGGDKIKKK